MTDVFVSYAHEDHEFVRKIVPALEAQGLSVWWDHTIPPGKTWDEVIAKGIADARCCIVIWSQNSVRSDWVKEEATMAKEGRKFLPVQIDASEPPVGFRRIQAANLQGWNGEAENTQWQMLVREVRGIIGGERASGPSSTPRAAYSPPPAARKSPPIALIGTVSAGALALLIIGVIMLRPGDTPSYFPPPATEEAAPVDPAALAEDPTKVRERERPSQAATSFVGSWTGDFIRTYNNPPSRSPLNITFNRDGTTDQGARYTVNGNHITFMLDGIHAMEGDIRGNRISGTWTYASLRGEWEVTRDGSGERVSGGSSGSGGGLPGPLAGSWEGDFIRLYSGRTTEPMGPIQFLANGRTSLGDAYTLSGNTVTFDYAGGHHLRGTVQGNRLRGTWTYGDGSLYGEFDLRRN